PVVAAQLAVGQHVDTDPSLHVQRGQYRRVLDCFELLGCDALLAEILARLLQFRWPQQTADVVGAVIRGHALLPHRLAIGNASRTVRAARAITASFSNADARGRYFMPQSGAICNRSGGMCRNARR